MQIVLCISLLIASCNRNNLDIIGEEYPNWITNEYNQIIEYEIDNWRFPIINEEGIYPHMEMCYSFMDSLVRCWPDRVMKYNPFTVESYVEDGITIRPIPTIRNKLIKDGFVDWPIYCKGINKRNVYSIDGYSVTLLPTPAYKTYIYRVSYGTEELPINNKKVVYIQAGIHAAEVMSQISACLFAETLLSEKGNMESLLSHYEFWIVPCLEGYGGMHGYSLSALGVNPNRNYATPWWEYDNMLTNSGKTPGDHLSVSISMNLIDYLCPSIAIDSHSLNDSVTQQSLDRAVGVFRCFPSEAFDYGMKASTYVSEKLKEKYDRLFTTDPSFEISCPTPGGARCFDYLYYKGIKTFATIEVNNIVESNRETTNSSEALSEAAFWFRNCVYALCMFDLEKDSI